jgi:putative oxidoreductase
MTMSTTQDRPAAPVRPWSPPLPRTGKPVAVGGSTGPGRRVDVVLAGITDTCRRYGPVALRLSLALVFVWFGALKLTGDSPVEGLIGATLPFLSTDVSLPVLGLVEVVLGLAVAVGRAPRVVLLVLAGHLAGTFLTFVTAPEFMFDDGNPLLLTADGEFVVKNLVLISAALVLVGREVRGSRSRRAAAVS